MTPLPTIELIGLPSDVNSSFERGPAQAPAAIRTALWSDRGNLACENGMEVGVEYNPRFDSNDRTAILAAKLVREDSALIVRNRT